MKHLVRLPGLSVAIVLMLFQFGLAQTLPDEYAMEAGAATKTVGSKGINFYDDGGAEANYSAMFEGTVTFIPLETGNKIKINFSEVDLGPANGSAKYSGDKIAIYQGTEAVKENLIGEYSSNNSEIGLIKSSAEDGALTIVFKSLDWTDFGYLPTAGWKATVSSFAPSPLSLAGLKVENACSVQSLRGKKNSPMLHISFSFEGETGSVSLDQLTFESAGTSDIANILQANVYYTGTSDIFTAENKFGAAATVAGKNFSFEKKLVINQEAVHHFWLAYDLAPDANLGDKLDAGFVSYQAGDESAEVAGGNPEGNTEIVSGLKGIYTLGASKEADFSTFEQLIGKINNLGIEESIVVEVEPGLYENCVIFPHAEGLSVEKTITVRSKTQNPEDVVFTPKLKGGTEKGIFHINGTDFLRLESMTFKTEQTRFESLVYMSGISRDNIIRNCVFEAPVYTDYTAHVNLFESKANNAENENNDRLWLDKNTFTGGYIAVYASGTGYVKLPKESGVRLTSNVLLNQGSKGIYLSNQKDALVEKNNVSNTQTAKIGFQGMDFYRMTGNSIVRGNQVYLALPGKMSAFGIEMRPASGSNEFPVQVYNNTVIVETGSSSSAGILLKDACEFLSLQHNSVLMKGESPQTALGIHARKSSQVPENVRIENNIFQTQSGEVIRTKYESFFNALSFSNNSIFSVGSEGSLAKISKEKSIKSIEEFNATGNAVNNLSEKADFLAPSILQLRSAGNLQSGKNIPEIATDIQGDARATVPTIGADEFREPDLIPPDFASSYPQAEAKDWQNLRLKAKITEAGKLYGVVLPADAEVPTKEMLLDNSSADSKPFSIHFVKELSANAELTWEVAGLSQNADYRVYYLLSDFSVLKNTSEIISQVIKTPFKPTEISDFEGELTEKNGLIYNGTSSFENIVLMQDGTNKAAKILAGELAKVRFLNTASGIACKGFKYKAKSGAQMKLRKKQDGAEVIALPAAVNWTFFDLRKKGKLLGFDIQASTEDFYFDDVHGSSNKLKVMPLAEQRVSLGESITLEPEISGGYPPYSAEWVNLGTNKTYSGTKLTFAPESSGLYRFTVTDDNETSVFGEITVLVTRQAEQGTAEELALEPESYWNGPVNSKGISSGFYTGGYHFTNTKVTSWFTWGGFAYSNRTNKDEAGGLSNQFTAAPGKGANGSKNYLVSYTFGSKAELTVSHAEDGGTVNGFFVTNNTFATYSMKNGDSMAKKFGGRDGSDKDWFKLTAEGIDSEGKSTGTADFYLADFRFEDDTQDYIVEDWRWFDLRALGKVKKIRFKLSSSDSSPYGMNTPAYFCMDEINKVPQVITWDAPDQITYGDDLNITSASSAVLPVVLTSSDESILRFVNGKAEVLKAGPVVVVARQSGSSKYLAAKATKEILISKARLEVTINSVEGESISYSIAGFVKDEDEDVLEGKLVCNMSSNGYEFSGLASENYQISYQYSGLNVVLSGRKKIQIHFHPNPASGYIQIKGLNGKTAQARWYNMNGQMVYNHSIQESLVNVSHLAKGMYIVRLTVAGKESLHRVELR